MTEQKSLFQIGEDEEIIERFSYSKLYLFKECPLRYKLHYIEGKPHKKQNLYYLNVGRYVHENLRFFFSTPVSMRSENLLIENLVHNWKSNIFKNESESNEWLSESKRMLTCFFKSEDFKKSPILIEANFKFKFGSSILRGKIDRVDKISENAYEIIDYKIGDRDTKVTLRDLREDLQWIFYWQGLKKKFRFNPVIVSFYYLASEKRFSFSPELSEVTMGLNRIKNLIIQIKSTENFLPKLNRECMSCLFKATCPAHNK